MEGKGRIIELKGNIGIVLMEGKGGCKNCKVCKKMVEREPVIEAENIVNAKFGDKVVVKIDENILLKISFFLYGMPLIGFIAGIIFSYILNSILLKIISFFSILLFFWYTGFRIAENYGKNNKPQIIRIEGRNGG